jgi:hypothetical protein
MQLSRRALTSIGRNFISKFTENIKVELKRNKELQV